LWNLRVDRKKILKKHPLKISKRKLIRLKGAGGDETRFPKVKIATPVEGDRGDYGPEEGKGGSAPGRFKKRTTKKTPASRAKDRDSE